MAVENRFSTVGRLLYAQILVAALVAAGFFWIGGWKSAISPFMGSGIALLPNVFFAYKIYLARNLKPQGVVNAFYVGETIKLVLTAALFSIALQAPDINFLTLLLGYVAVLSVFWFALYYWRD